MINFYSSSNDRRIQQQKIKIKLIVNVAEKLSYRLTPVTNKPKLNYNS